MALSPGIPTSFVPKQPMGPHSGRPVRSGTNVFLIVSLIFFGITAIIGAITFGYLKFVERTLAVREAELAQAQAQINEETVEDFVRLRDRLASGMELLDGQIMLSQFLNTLERLTLDNVRFNTMNLTVTGDRSATIEVAGTATSFNALAAQSSAFAGERDIKRAIFSDIAVGEDRLVSFTLTADIDPGLIVANENGLPADTSGFGGEPSSFDAPVSTTTP